MFYCGLGELGFRLLGKKRLIKQIMISLDRTSQSYLLLDRHHMFIHKEGIHMKEMKAQLLVKLLWASIQSIHPETTFCPILKH